MELSTRAHSYKPARQGIAGPRVRGQSAGLNFRATSYDEIRGASKQRLEDARQITGIVAAISVHEEYDVVISYPLQRSYPGQAGRAVASARLFYHAGPFPFSNLGRFVAAAVVNHHGFGKALGMERAQDSTNGERFVESGHDNVHGHTRLAYIAGMSRSWLLVLTISTELGALSGIAAIDDLRGHIPSFLMLFAVASSAFFVSWRLTQRLALRGAHIAALALVLRLPMLIATPSLSDDVWRYLHDGRAQLAGVSPYAFAPADPATQSFRGPEHPRINHPTLVTIYPPIAQKAFLLNAWAGSGLLSWRLLLLACELVLIATLGAFLKMRGRPVTNLVLYAWHPLAVVEATGSAHLEPIGLALMSAGLLAAAFGRDVRAGILIGLSIAVKFLTAPLLLICDLLRTPRTVLAALTTLLVAYALFASSVGLLGSLGTFAVQWQANAGLYALFALVLDGYRARIAVATLLVCAALLIKRTRALDEERAGMFVFALLLLSPVVHPWYILWLLVFAPLFGEQYQWIRRAVLVWSVSITLSYVGSTTTVGLVEYLPVYAVLGYGIFTQNKRRSVPLAPPLVQPAESTY